ncbi:MAG: DEAD/DEAH box helicase [Nanoarchaeota archaeon]|nr:DEAD/DEAH box helicase [Nanoarchaeota archaeon]
MQELPKIIKENLKEKNITELRPPQLLSLNKGVLEGKSLIISSPTSSGKTLVAEIAMIKHFENKGKTLYIVPLKSLATEKYSSFKALYEKHGLRVALSIGEFDKQDPYLNNFDVIICTSEKADSLIRHNAAFIRRVSCVVIDEIHLLDDADRGPTLEVLITTLKHLLPKAQIIGLSATINNDYEISEWLNAELVKSSYRPVELFEGVYFNSELFFKDKSYVIEDYKSEEESITKDTLVRDKQVIFFMASRRNTRGLAKRLSGLVEKFLSPDLKSRLDIIADKVLYSLEQPTEQCRLLSDLVRNGVAFHHAGLVQNQKELVEQAFRDRTLKVICATPTLAAGVNLPAFRVVVRDLTRYSQTTGNYFIPVLEVKQMFGRAGRPGFEEYGEALAIAKSETDKEKIFSEYINGEVEAVYSKLGVEPALRTHVLALIANNFCTSFESLKNFFKNTFFAKQYKNLSQLNLLIENIVVQLVHFTFAEKNKDTITATALGRRVSELYLDPLVADNIICSIVKAKRIKPSSFTIIQALCYSGGVRNLSINGKEAGKLVGLGDESELLIDVPNPFSYEYDNYLRSIKTSLMFESWINEDSEQSISEAYKVFPGDLRNYIYSIDWLLYSMVELSNIFGEKNMVGYAKRLRTRFAYGIKDELFTLVSIKGVGRVRARKLYNAGYKNFQEVIKAPFEKIAAIIGPGIAKKIREESD